MDKIDKSASLLEDLQKLRTFALMVPGSLEHCLKDELTACADRIHNHLLREQYKNG